MLDSLGTSGKKREREILKGTKIKSFLKHHPFIICVISVLSRIGVNHPRNRSDKSMRYSNFRKFFAIGGSPTSFP